MITKRFAKCETLPPTKDSLTQHVVRVNYQTLLWKQSLEAFVGIPSPIGNGWEADGESVKAKLMTKDCAPKSLLLVVSCHCLKLLCSGGRCSCSKECIPCISACGCGAEDACKNPYTASVTNSADSEDESCDEEDDF